MSLAKKNSRGSNGEETMSTADQDGVIARITRRLQIIIGTLVIQQERQFGG
jgi:hypothetical protein